MKAENELLRNDAAEQTAMIKHWKKKAKKLTELESQLKKEQMELITEKKVVAELKRKLDKEFVTKTNLEVTLLCLLLTLVRTHVHGNVWLHAGYHVTCIYSGCVFGQCSLQ